MPGRPSVPVVLEDVTKSYAEPSGARAEGNGRPGRRHRVVAIDRVSLEFPSGKLSTLLGPSGCGKTTTLRCIAGFSEPDTGIIRIGDRVVNGVPPYDRPTGTVFQNYALFPHMTVFENVAYGLRVRRLPKAAIAEKVYSALELLHLRDLADRQPSQLSGGQQQRVAIARVLVTEPQVLLLDEPLSNLDAKLRVYMRLELKHLQQTLGITTIYVTHDQEEAMAISDRMAVMNQGRIEQFGTPMEIYRRPATQFVAEFIGVANILEGTVQRVLDGRGRLIVEVDGVRVVGEPDRPYRSGDRVQVLIRPEMFRLEPAGPGGSVLDPSGLAGASPEGSGGPAGWFGRVVSVSFLGPVAHYEVEFGGRRVTVYQFSPRHMFAPGDPVVLSVIDGDLSVRQGWSAPVRARDREGGVA